MGEDQPCLAGIRLAWAKLESKRIHHYLTIHPVTAASIIPTMYSTLGTSCNCSPTANPI